MSYGQIQSKKIVVKELSQSQKLEQEKTLIKWVTDQIAVDKQLLLNKFPFTGNIISRLDVEVGYWDDIKTACTDGEKIWVNALFYAKLDNEERQFVLGHECWHIILRHFLRKMNRNKELWNWATDLEIHFLLTKEGMKAPFVLPHDPNWKDLSFEEIYEKLVEQQEKNNIKQNDTSSNDFDKQNDNSQNTNDNSSSICNIPNEWCKGKDSKNLNGSKNGIGFDLHNKKNNPESNNDPKEIESNILDKIKSATNFVYKRNRGLLPAHIKSLIDDLPKNEIPWEQMLRQFVTQTIHGNRTWIPPNRRHIWKNIYIQSSKQEEFHGVVALDTSGSCTNDLPKFFSELVGLLNTFGKYELDVIQCDSKIQNVEHYSDEINPPNNKKWKMYGGGGTSHLPIFEWISKNVTEEPNCLIALTDGYTEIPKNPPPYPVLWILTNDGIELPWGINIKL